ncbi:MAG: phosphodiester glycosidase family protein [Chloroflexota bacterium]
MIQRLWKLLLRTFILISAFFIIWAFYILIQRPARQTVTQPLYEGVTYYREVWQEPRSLIFHIVEVDRTAEGVEFFVTPGVDLEGDNDYLAQKTTDFLLENNLQLAINGDFFRPFESLTPFHYYPYVGDPIDIMGFAISDGVTYSTPENARPVLCITPETAVIEKFICPPDTLQAMGGGTIFYENSEVVMARLERLYLRVPQPRTMIALDETGDTIWFILVDGRQRRYSEGIGLQEMTPLLEQLGAKIALNLDGGGSVTLAIEENGRSKILNSPIHTRIPLRERPIGNHLGIYAQPLE